MSGFLFPGLGDDSTITTLSDPMFLSGSLPSVDLNPCDFNICGPSPSSVGASSPPINWNNILPGLFASSEKILQQTTVPAGQIQITGPNGQSEVIQAAAGQALPGSIPGLNIAGIGSSGSWMWILLIGGAVLLFSEEHR